MKDTITHFRCRGWPSRQKRQLFQQASKDWVSFDFSIQRVWLITGKFHRTPDEIVSHTCSEKRQGFWLAWIGYFSFKKIIILTSQKQLLPEKSSKHFSFSERETDCFFFFFFREWGTRSNSDLCAKVWMKLRLLTSYLFLLSVPFSFILVNNL